jgi:hypothetical protein
MLACPLMKLVLLAREKTYTPSSGRPRSIRQVETCPTGTLLDPLPWWFSNSYRAPGVFADPYRGKRFSWNDLRMGLAA